MNFGVARPKFRRSQGVRKADAFARPMPDPQIVIDRGATAARSRCTGRQVGAALAFRMPNCASPEDVRPLLARMGGAAVWAARWPTRPPAASRRPTSAQLRGQAGETDKMRPRRHSRTPRHPPAPDDARLLPGDGARPRAAPVRARGQGQREPCSPTKSSPPRSCAARSAPAARRRTAVRAGYLRSRSTTASSRSSTASRRALWDTYEQAHKSDWQRSAPLGVGMSTLNRYLAAGGWPWGAS